VSRPRDDGFRLCSFFLEATLGRPDQGDIVDAIGNSPLFKDVQVKETHNGILVDTLNFPLTWNTGDRVVMPRAQFFAGLVEGLRKHFKSGAEVVMHEMGYHHGRPTWENLLTSYRVRDKADLDEAFGSYSANGWGRAEVVSFDLAGKRAVVRLRDNFECSGQGPSARPGETSSGAHRGDVQRHNRRGDQGG
jgi:predicted hydrocarbon binding protein